MKSVGSSPNYMYASELDYGEVDGGVDPEEAIGQG
jgi:hypothetical protein